MYNYTVDGKLSIKEYSHQGFIKEGGRGSPPSPLRNFVPHISTRLNAAHYMPPPPKMFSDVTLCIFHWSCDTRLFIGLDVRSSYEDRGRSVSAELQDGGVALIKHASHRGFASILVYEAQ